MRVKRWLLLLLAGVAAIGLGFAYLLRDIYQTWTFPPVVYYLTLQFLSRPVRAALFGIAGLSAIAVAVFQLNRSLLEALQLPNGESIVEALYRHRQRERGPKVVAIGGGTGLSNLLRGLKHYTAHITAIVTVADDGGSSGRLRRELGVLPPGDFRNCLAALANDEALITKLFQYRFAAGAGLDGHSFGNLFIAAMVGITGNFERAIIESEKVLAIQGRIVPSTLENVTLYADLRMAQAEQVLVRRVEGESVIPEQGWPIERVYLKPDEPPAYPGAVRAILDADMIIIGPGSLYTSILPNLLVPDIARAIRASRAFKVYVCNVATQPGETDGFSVEDHLRALEQHVGPGIVDYVLGNSQRITPPADANYQMVTVGGALPPNYILLTAELVDAEQPWRHDSHKLARVLFEAFNKRRLQGASGVNEGR
ncbi:MAG: gluconeogenesis factor YvcK family protein [Anaerolineae bacterium]